MPRKKKTPTADAALPSIPSELIDQIVKGPMSADAVNAASKAFKKALIERCLGAELSHHLGYVPGAEKRRAIIAMGESVPAGTGKASQQVLV
jgi:hypothetical protein